jgi:hypothetical protein
VTTGGTYSDHWALKVYGVFNYLIIQHMFIYFTSIPVKFVVSFSSCNWLLLLSPVLLLVMTATAYQELTATLTDSALTQTPTHNFN